MNSSTVAAPTLSMRLNSSGKYRARPSSAMPSSSKYLPRRTRRSVAGRCNSDRRTSPSATASGKLLFSIPALKEIGTVVAEPLAHVEPPGSSPARAAAGRRGTSPSGRPGRSRGGSRTISVLAELHAEPSPRRCAVSRSRSINPSAWLPLRVVLERLESGTRMFEVPPSHRAANWRSRSGPSSVGLSLITQFSPTSRSRKSMIRSISSGGQPWNVLSVSVSLSRVRYSRSRYDANSSGSRFGTLHDRGGRVHHPVDERTHAVGLDALEVVADAHVVDNVAEPGRDFERRSPQHLDEHRPLDVLVERLLELQLLRPLDVVADRPHVDARARNLQLVHDLDGLEFHDPAPGEPGEHEVLGHLRVRARGRPERARRRPTMKQHRGVAGGFVGVVAEEPLLARQIEDSVVPVEFGHHPSDQPREGVGYQLGHHPKMIPAGARPVRIGVRDSVFGTIAERSIACRRRGDGTADSPAPVSGTALWI